MSHCTAMFAWLVGMRRNTVSKPEHRIFIYGALLLLCAIGGVFMGAGAALWTFLQVVGVVELICLIGNARDESTLHG